MTTDRDRAARHTGTRRVYPAAIGVLALLIAELAAFPFAHSALQAETGPGISKAAAGECARKVKALETSSARTGNRGTQTTRISEAELNSFLAYELSPKYHASLKSLTVRLEPGRLQAVATVDFDQLGMSSKKSVTRLLASLLTGKHTLTAYGKLIADGGRANFQLERAMFDDISLPNLLVEEIISTVGKRQKPPFDPMQPSQMPYGIQKVETGQGYITVYQ